MKTARIMDNVFLYAGGKSASLWGDNFGESSDNVTWIAGGKPNLNCWFSDAAINSIKGFRSKKLNIAWLCEPPGYREVNYTTIQELYPEFDWILTFDKRLLDKGGKYLYYPMGGSMIRREQWGIPLKSKKISMIVSGKKDASGHKYRHELVESIKAADLDIDILGSGYGEYIRKIDGVYSYAYTVVVEVENLNYFFGEKLIDAFSVGTIPIYWGCPSIGDIFNADGILKFETPDDLVDIVKQICSSENYMSRLPAIEENLERCKAYRTAEDWIFNHYPFLFED
jgi:hypothetical protein